jgi:hypothetical protein
MGKACVEQLSNYLPAVVPLLSTTTDYYHATNNPTGSLLHSGTTAYSTMAGTTGTHTPSTGFTSTGQLATGFTSLRSGATSTATATCSKASRSDGQAGEAQVVALSATTVGGSDEIHNLRATPAISEVASGDWYYAECRLEVTGAPVNINAIELYLLETRPSNSQTAIDGAYNSSASLLLPTVTWSETLRTPPIQRTSDATALQVNIRTRMNTTSGAASVTYKITDYAVRKVAVGPVNLMAGVSWVAGSNTTLSTASGKARATRISTDNPRIAKQLTGLQIGATYRMQGSVYNGTASSVYLRVSDSVELSSGTAVYTVATSGAADATFVATATTHWVGIVPVTDADGQYGEIDDAFSVTKV